MKFFLFTLFILLAANNGFCAAPPLHENKTVEKLSVEETVRIAQFESFHRWFSFKTVDNETPLNPDARPEIYKIINDPNAGMNSARVTLYLGLLGQAEDVEKLEGILDGFKGKVLTMEQEQGNCWTKCCPLRIGKIWTSKSWFVMRQNLSREYLGLYQLP